jgi:hypothetical protein
MLKVQLEPGLLGELEATVDVSSYRVPKVATASLLILALTQGLDAFDKAPIQAVQEILVPDGHLESAWAERVHRLAIFFCQEEDASVNVANRSEGRSTGEGCGVRRIRPPSSVESDHLFRRNPTTQFGVSDHLGEGRAAT